MSVLSDSDTEAEVVSRNLCGVVDIGSNGIRFSISSKAQHHARIMPCVFKDRLGISLYEIQYESDTGKQIPIPDDIIDEIVSAMKRFKLICEDFGVPQSGVRVIATEATRLALNCDQFIDAIESSTGWDVELLSREEEEKSMYMVWCHPFILLMGFTWTLVVELSIYRGCKRLTAKSNAPQRL